MIVIPEEDPILNGGPGIAFIMPNDIKSPSVTTDNPITTIHNERGAKQTPKQTSDDKVSKLQENKGSFKILTINCMLIPQILLYFYIFLLTR